MQQQSNHKKIGCLCACICCMLGCGSLDRSLDAIHSQSSVDQKQIAAGVHPQTELIIRHWPGSSEHRGAFVEPYVMSRMETMLRYIESYYFILGRKAAPVEALPYSKDEYGHPYSIIEYENMVRVIGAGPDGKMCTPDDAWGTLVFVKE